MKQAEPEAPRVLRVLPWGLLGKTVLAWAVLLAPIVYVYGPAFGGVTALVGLVPAFGGHIIGHRRQAFAATASLLLGICVFAASQSVIWAWTGACLLILCAGLEAHKTGGRAFVLALYGWCGLALSPNLPGAADALPFILAGLSWGTLSVRFLGLNGVAALPPYSRRYSFSLCVFLLVGLVVAVRLNAELSGEYGYWVVLLFVLRALSSPQESLQTAFIYGVGAAFGSAVAFLVMLSPAPAGAKLAMSFLLSIAGLRTLPHPGPWSAAAFTSAILLLLPVGVEGVVLRAEAAALAVGLAIALTIAIGLFWTLLWKIADPQEVSS
ncbi:MAG: hypothetical protein AAGA38_03775 [Pseudomonadota bacterium]